MQAHRRDETEHAARMVSVTQRFGDRLSRREKQVHLGNEKDRPEATRRNDRASWARRIPLDAGAKLSLPSVARRDSRFEIF